MIQELKWKRTLIAKIIVMKSGEERCQQGRLDEEWVKALIQAFEHSLADQRRWILHRHFKQGRQSEGHNLQDVKSKRMKVNLDCSRCATKPRHLWRW